MHPVYTTEELSNLTRRAIASHEHQGTATFLVVSKTREPPKMGWNMRYSMRSQSTTLAREKPSIPLYSDQGTTGGDWPAIYEWASSVHMDILPFPNPPNQLLTTSESGGGTNLPITSRSCPRTYSTTANTEYGIYESCSSVDLTAFGTLLDNRFILAVLSKNLASACTSRLQLRWAKPRFDARL